ncbi:MAG: hypothetical protein PHO64_10595 [Thiomonas sp.]|nr:hypothetical protein [Thiomonas sp.]
MSKAFRPLLILLLVLLPLRGWAQVSMAAGDCVASAAPQSAQAPLHGQGDMTAMDMTAAEPCHTASGADCGSHDHQHCVICHLAVGQPSPLTLLLADAAQHACPPAANTAWHSADPRTLQRPPRV